MAAESNRSISEKIKSKGVQIGQVKDLERPWGIAVHQDLIIVSESEGHCVTVCKKSGEKVTTIGKKGYKAGELTSLLGVAVTTDAHVLVMDHLRVQKFTLDGNYVASASVRKLGLKSPFAAARHPQTGQIYIADAEEHSIIVINPDLSLAFTFGTKGSANGQLNKPRDIAINSQGTVFVIDTNNDRICKFATDGTYLTSIGTPGSPGELDRPSAVAVDDHDYLYVTEMVNGRVFVYDSNDQFIHSFGKCGSKDGQYSGPMGVAIDPQGDIIVSDTYNNRLVIT